MKKYISALLFITIIFTLCGCTQTAESSVDIHKLGNALSTGLSFDGEIIESTADAAYANYGLDEGVCTDAAFYRAGNSVCDEIAIFKAADSESVKTVEEAVDGRIKYLRDGFGDYKPSEVPKIEKAYTETVGNVVILCICSDTSGIEDIIKSVN